MNQSTTFTKLLRILQFRKHIKELTSTCKRVNKDGCYKFVKGKTETLSSNKKLVKCSKKERKKNYLIQTPPLTVDQSLEHLSSATPTSPANLSIIISQSYKPLHTKSTQFNKNTIAVTKGTLVKALYQISNWVFIEIIETGQTGLVPIYCFKSSCESPSYNNLSLLNVSTSPPTGQFLSTIGPCYLNNQSKYSIKAQTFARPSIKNESPILSRQISELTINTPRKQILSSPQTVIFRSNNRLRTTENYQRQFIGDISVIESEIVTLVDTENLNNDWRLVKRGDGKQGYIPKHIVKID